jgi:hypothetical protein
MLRAGPVAGPPRAAMTPASRTRATRGLEERKGMRMLLQMSTLPAPDKKWQ